MSFRKRRTSERAGARSTLSYRHERLERMVLDELRSILRDEARAPGLEGIVLLRLDLAPDGSHARIAYAASAMEGEEESRVARRSGAALEAAAGFLRARLASSLNLERVPKLGFTFVGVAAEPARCGEEEPCLE